MGLTHTLLGVGGFSALTSITPEYFSLDATTLGVVAIGSLFPDIDDTNSWLGRRLWPIAKVISLMTRHRGFTHSLLGAALITIGMILVANAGYSIASVFLFGYILHLLADFFSNSGVPLLWPSKERYRFPYAIQTGGVLEYILSLTLGSALVYGLVIHFINLSLSL